MKKYFLATAIILVILSIQGCSYSITDIDVKHKESSCVRECTKSYSSAISQGNQIGFKTETLRAARDAYSICVSTCPTK
jgi:hypothetical protein